MEVKDKDILDYKISCSSSDECYMFGRINGIYDLNFMLKNYCSKKGHNCPVKNTLNNR